VQKQRVVSELRRIFPELDRSTPKGVKLTAAPADLLPDVSDFARCLREEFEAANDTRVRAAFNCLEQFLLAGDRDLRQWVLASIEALQNATCWRRYGSSALARFLGLETRALWEALDRFRSACEDLDLADCSVLEAEILTWRLVHEKARLLAHGC
jgi:DNA-binding SARP family transcriptional activator